MLEHKKLRNAIGAAAVLIVSVGSAFTGCASSQPLPDSGDSGDTAPDTPTSGDAPIGAVGPSNSDDSVCGVEGSTVEIHDFRTAGLWGHCEVFLGNLWLNSRSQKIVNWPHLERIDGGLRITSETFERVRFEGLTHIGGNFEIIDTNLSELFIPALERINGQFRWEGPTEMTDMNLLAVEHLGGLFVNTVDGSASKLNHFRAPKLRTIETFFSFLISRDVSSIEMPLLESVNFLNIDGCSNVDTLVLDSLAEVDTLKLIGLHRLTTFPDLSSLQTAGTIDISINESLVNIDIPEGATVEFAVNSAANESLTSLHAPSVPCSQIFQSFPELESPALVCDEDN
jgi:hypothetical protein